MNVTDLPALNAALNAVSTVFLLLGYRFIREGRQTAHRNCMLAACGTSVLFLASYVTYHVLRRQMTGSAHTTFAEPAWFRPVYLVILFTHLVGAMAIVPLVLVTLWRALRGRFEAHRRLAHWTWPLWLYVSLTGVLIYLLLYQIFPQTHP
ncbi:MAG: DUF420 domain-containing protein [Verrucomicrobia bacterium]|nr:DUF420 domain-containing protein [Verrucomicrobiota bacterium]